MLSRVASAAVALSLVAPATPAAARVGALTQLPGKAGCVTQPNSQPEVKKTCTVRRFAGGQLWDLAISPDGRNLYVASIGGAVSILRIAHNGELRQLRGGAGCINPSGRLGCRALRQLVHSETIEVSPDGRNVYVGVSAGGAGGVLTFTRNTRTGALGKVGCLGEDGKRGCATVRTRFTGSREIALSPDGRSVYAVSGSGSASGVGTVVAFHRSVNGRLSELPGPAACLNADGSGGCTQTSALLPGCCGIAISPDSHSVYLSSTQSLPPASSGGMGSAHFALATFSRDDRGVLTRLGCVNQDGSGGCSAAAFEGSEPLNEAGDIVISPNGRSLYLAHSSTFPEAEASICDASFNYIAVFPRAPGGALGPLAQDVGSCGSIPVLSPDGKTVYATTGNFGNEVSIFSRNRATGVLSAAGCIDPYVQSCQKAKHLTAPSALAITPDGRHVYVISDDIAVETLGIFRRSLR
jgi:DNA-binding beta-propeller fold protein YncE